MTQIKTYLPSLQPKASPFRLLTLTDTHIDMYNSLRRRGRRPLNIERGREGTKWYATLKRLLNLVNDEDNPLAKIEEYDRYQEGRCRYYKAEFASGDIWNVAVRFCSRRRGAVSEIFEREQNMLRLMDERNVKWAPKIRGAGVSLDDDFSYLATSWTPGECLVWNEEQPEREMRDKVMKQLALIHEDILEKTKVQHCESISSALLRRSGLLMSSASERR